MKSLVIVDERKRLSGVPDLLGDFETVRKVFAASMAEVSSIRGIGKVTVHSIARFLDASYRPFLKRPQQLRLEEWVQKVQKSNNQPVRSIEYY